jgi:hypothetical protein
MGALPLVKKLDLWPSEWRKDILRLVLAILLAAAIMGLTISEAKRRGMHHAVMISYGEQIAISIALSEAVYGLRLGYVGFTSVLNAIQEHWNQGTNGWSDLSKLIENFHSRQVLNDGIRAAASLGPQKPGYFTDGSLITTIYDDMGEVDFYKLSFAIFGQKIESAFNTFFLLIGLSTLTFILTFRNNIYALSALLCTLFAFYVELHLAVFDPVAMPTLFGMRRGSTLGLVPMWYFALLLTFPRKLTPALLVGAILQLAILILAWRIRGSVTWVFIFLFVLAVVLPVVRYWTAQSEKSWFDGGLRQSWSAMLRACSNLARLWPLLLRDSLRWPIVLLLLGMLANAVYNQQSRHLIYSTDDVIPHHGLWWAGVNAFYDKAPEVFGARVKNTEGTPEGWWHLRDYLERTHVIPWTGAYTTGDPVPGLMSPWTSGLKYRLVDEVMKRIFLEALVRDPLASARVYLMDQPSHMIQQLVWAFKGAKSTAWLWLTLAAGVGIFAFVLLLGNHNEFNSLRRVILLSGAALAGSWLPILWANASWASMPDTILLSLCFMSLALGLGAYRLFRYDRLTQQDTFAPIG